MNDAILTIITPTTGKKSLFKLIDSLKGQSVPFIHLLLWDDVRHDDFLYWGPKTNKAKSPFDLELEEENRIINSIVIKGNLVQGKANGSALRGVGLMAANTKYVTFADSDVWFEKNHLESLVEAIKGKEWAYGVRKIWTDDGEYLGEDRFESIGDESKLPYQLIDNSSLIVTREFASAAAVIYRETKEYNDDRLMYAFLKKHAGKAGRTNMATCNQVCPKRLEEFFRRNCTNDSITEK